MWLIRGCFWFPRCFLACVVVSWSLLVASVVLGVCGCFAFVFCSLSDCWRVWLVRGCFWLPQWLLACVVVSWLFLAAGWLLACGYVSWLFLVLSVVAGVCRCFVVVSGSLGGCWRVWLFRGCFWFPRWTAGVCGCLAVVTGFLCGCWRVWLFHGCPCFLRWLLACGVVSCLGIDTGVVLSISERLLEKKSCIWYRKVNNAKAIVPPGKHVVIT